ncbi:MAG: glycerol-3-phosphate dehydrogenase subunit GlpB [Bacteroidales bacterium]|nr:glycerol-3-phosphate dehydrogenase subunit GlpB [Bacteroidales bacterium]
MKFDAIIIGGGLSGLTAGLALQKAGKRVAIVSMGQSTLHFNSGSFDLLGYDAQGAAVANPLEAIAALDDKHPYKKCADVAALAQEAKALLAEAGVKVNGDAKANHFRITPMGAVKPAWLTIDDYATLNAADKLAWKKVALVNVIGYLDFPTKFIAAGLRKLGAEVDVKAFTTAELDTARKSPSEMRASNIAKVLGNEDAVLRMAAAVNEQVAAGKYDVVLLPAVLGIADAALSELLKKSVNAPVQFIATLPPSVPGVRVQTLLRKRFIAGGGVHLTGDKAIGGTIEGDTLKCINTENLTETCLKADNFILASGSFVSGGLSSNYEAVTEAVLGLDVDAPEGDHGKWVEWNVFDAQPYMEFGVATDAALHVKKNGKVINNCYAVGSVLGGHNRVKMADGTGVSMLTALQAVKNILK